jgi:hypothetical protein
LVSCKAVLTDVSGGATPFTDEAVAAYVELKKDGGEVLYSDLPRAHHEECRLIEEEAEREEAC